MACRRRKGNYDIAIIKKQLIKLLYLSKLNIIIYHNNLSKLNVTATLKFSFYKCPVAAFDSYILKLIY